jgi:hypothetical protein
VSSSEEYARLSRQIDLALVVFVKAFNVSMDGLRHKSTLDELNDALDEYKAARNDDIRAYTE